MIGVPELYNPILYKIIYDMNNNNADYYLIKSPSITKHYAVETRGLHKICENN